VLLADELGKKLHCFEANAHRMQYARFKTMVGMFTGSGAIEAGCKAIVAQRAKQIRYALDSRRRSRHHRAALPARQRPMG
jgi:hypothetical protein